MSLMSAIAFVVLLAVLATVLPPVRSRFDPDQRSTILTVLCVLVLIWLLVILFGGIRVPIARTW